MNAGTINTEQILTNLFIIDDATATNYVTNYNTVLVGNANGVGIAAQLGAGLWLTNVPTSFTNTGVITTNLVPTLEFIGQLSALPLEVNIGPWTNSLSIPAGSHVDLGPTNTVNAYWSGGTPPITNTWSVATVSSSQMTQTQLALTVTNGLTTQIVATLNPNSNPAYITYSLSCRMLDSSGQIAVSPQVAYVTFHYP